MKYEIGQQRLRNEGFYILPDMTQIGFYVNNVPNWNSRKKMERLV